MCLKTHTPSVEIFFGECRQCEDGKEETVKMKWYVVQKVGKSVKRTASRKNLTSRSDDNAAAPSKPKASMIRGKAKKTAIHKKPAVSDALLYNQIFSLGIYFRIIRE